MQSFLRQLLRNLQWERIKEAVFSNPFQLHAAQMDLVLNLYLAGLRDRSRRSLVFYIFMQYCYDGHRTQTGAPGVFPIDAPGQTRNIRRRCIDTYVVVNISISLAVVNFIDSDDNDGRKMKSKTLSSFRVGVECL